MKSLNLDVGDDKQNSSFDSKFEIQKHRNWAKIREVQEKKQEERRRKSELKKVDS